MNKSDFASHIRNVFHVQGLQVSYWNEQLVTSVSLNSQLLAKFSHNLRDSMVKIKGQKTYTACYLILYLI